MLWKIKDIKKDTVATAKSTVASDKSSSKETAIIRILRGCFYSIVYDAVVFAEQCEAGVDSDYAKELAHMTCNLNTVTEFRMKALSFYEAFNSRCGAATEIQFFGRGRKECRLQWSDGSYIEATLC